MSGNVECFKHCKQLIDIDINYPELTEDFFANIASFVPKLQSLQISTNKLGEPRILPPFRPQSVDELSRGLNLFLFRIISNNITKITFINLF